MSHGYLCRERHKSDLMRMCFLETKRNVLGMGDYYDGT